MYFKNSEFVLLSFAFGLNKKQNCCQFLKNEQGKKYCWVYIFVRNGQEYSFFFFFFLLRTDFANETVDTEEKSSPRDSWCLE